MPLPGPLRWIARRLTIHKARTPPNPLRQQMSTDQAIREARATQERLIAELAALVRVAEEIRDTEWREPDD